MRRGVAVMLHHALGPLPPLAREGGGEGLLAKRAAVIRMAVARAIAYYAIVRHDAVSIPYCAMPDCKIP